MTSRSTSSTSRLVVLVIALLSLAASSAAAGPRKRIVVLEFEGPKAEEFHDDLVKLIKKSQHTVIPTDKWNGVATDLDASKVTEKNVKKVAKKLKIDGVVTGKIEKRRDEYIVHLKLRAGASGELVGNPVDTTADGPSLSGQARKDVKDELIGAIGDLSANHGGGDDDAADDKPAKKGAKDDDAADPKPSKKTAKGDDDDNGTVKKGFSKHADKGGDRVGDDDDSSKKKSSKKDDDTTVALSTKTSDDPPPKSKKSSSSDDDSDSDSTPRRKKKRVAASDEDGGSASASSDVAPAPQDASIYTPGNRAIDVSLGASFTARTFNYNVSTSVAALQAPPTYKVPYPVGGAYLDLTVYPLAFGHNRHDIASDLGVEVFYDKALKLNTEAPDGNMVADLATSMERLGFYAVLRHRFIPAFTAGVKLGYISQRFDIAQAAADTTPTNVPDVAYGIISPVVFLRYTVIPKVHIGLDATYLLVSGTGGGTGDLGGGDYYVVKGASGYDAGVSGEYDITTRIFVRASARYEVISTTFGNSPKADPGNLSGEQTVFGSKDQYIAFGAVAGYLF
jgi:hypothetical protein